MKSYERPVAEQLQAEAARIPLPPRERWVPAERHRPRLMPALATIGVLALAVLVIAPVLEQLRMRDAVGIAPPASSAASSGTCGPTQNQTTSAACLLVPGTLVEIVGYRDGYREASTPLVRVKLESAKMSEEFGNPVLFEADARTEIDPRSANIAATGVKVGARVQVSFDPRAPKTSSGAYLLTRFVVVSDGRLPDCSVELDIDLPPPPGPQLGTGAMSAEDAFRRTFPNVTDFKWFPGGSSPDSRAPVWVVAASGETYVVTATGPANGTNNWFAYPAKFVRCLTPQEIRDRQIAPGASPPPTNPDGTRG